MLVTVRSQRVTKQYNFTLPFFSLLEYLEDHRQTSPMRDIIYY